MTYEAILHKALDYWARTLGVASHVFVLSIMKPALKAAYNKGHLDGSEGKLSRPSRGVAQGMHTIKQLLPKQ